MYYLQNVKNKITDLKRQDVLSSGPVASHFSPVLLAHSGKLLLLKSTKLPSFCTTKYVPFESWMFVDHATLVSFLIRARLPFSWKINDSISAFPLVPDDQIGELRQDNTRLPSSCNLSVTASFLDFRWLPLLRTTKWLYR